MSNIPAHSNRAGVPRRIQVELAVGILRACGGSGASSQQVISFLQSTTDNRIQLKSILDINTSLFGPPNSNLRLRVQTKVKQWRSFTPNRIDNTFDDLGAREALRDEEQVYPSADVDPHPHPVADQQRPRKSRRVSQQSSAPEPAQQPLPGNPQDTQPSMAAAMLDARANRVANADRITVDLTNPYNNREVIVRDVPRDERGERKIISGFRIELPSIDISLFHQQTYRAWLAPNGKQNEMLVRIPSAVESEIHDNAVNACSEALRKMDLKDRARNGFDCGLFNEAFEKDQRGFRTRYKAKSNEHMRTRLLRLVFPSTVRLGVADYQEHNNTGESSPQYGTILVANLVPFTWSDGGRQAKRTIKLFWRVANEAAGQIDLEDEPEILSPEELAMRQLNDHVEGASSSNSDNSSASEETASGEALNCDDVMSTSSENEASSSSAVDSSAFASLEDYLSYVPPVSATSIDRRTYSYLIDPPETTGAMPIAESATRRRTGETEERSLLLPTGSGPPTTSSATHMTRTVRGSVDAAGVCLDALKDGEEVDNEEHLLVQFTPVSESAARGHTDDETQEHSALVLRPSTASLATIQEQGPLENVTATLRTDTGSMDTVDLSSEDGRDWFAADYTFAEEIDSLPESQSANRSAESEAFDRNGPDLGGEAPVTMFVDDRGSKKRRVMKPPPDTKQPPPASWMQIAGNALLSGTRAMTSTTASSKQSPIRRKHQSKKLKIVADRGGKIAADRGGKTKKL